MVFLRFVYAIMGDWWSRVSGPLSIPAAVLGLWVTNDVAKIAFMLTAYICVWVTAYRLWKPAKLSAVFDPEKSQCRSESEFRPIGGGSSRNGIVYRIQIKNIGGETIHNCEGQLAEVAFENEKAELGAANLTWCGEFPPTTKIDLRGGFIRELDVLIIYEDGTVSITTPGWPPNNRQNFFARRGRYRFTIMIGGDGTATLPPYRLTLNYTGDWKTSTMEATHD
jgi:hypothetical protein